MSERDVDPDAADAASDPEPSIPAGRIVVVFAVSVAVMLGGALLATRLDHGVKAEAPSSPSSSSASPSGVAGQPPGGTQRVRAGVGDLLPALVVVQRGQPLQLHGPRARPTLLHLWATWCGPCRAELPLILDYGRTGAADVLALSVDDHWESVERYFGADMPTEVAWDPKIVVEPALGVRSLPATFVIDTDGRIVRQLTGAQDWRDPTLRQSIAALRRP